MRFGRHQPKVSGTLHLRRLRHRQRDDRYAHEVLAEPPFEGILVSKAIVDGTAALNAMGAMMIGMVQALNEGLDGTPGGDWTRSIVFGILIAILVFRPEGLLGERTPEGA